MTPPVLHSCLPLAQKHHLHVVDGVKRADNCDIRQMNNAFKWRLALARVG